MLLAVQSFWIFLKHNIFGFISETFTLNWHIFVTLTNKKLLFPLECRLNTNRFPDSITLIEYLASDVIEEPSSPCVGPSSITKIISFLIISIHWWTLSPPKIIRFLPQEFKIEKSELESNPIPYPE